MAAGKTGPWWETGPWRYLAEADDDGSAGHEAGYDGVAQKVGEPAQPQQPHCRVDGARQYCHLPPHPSLQHHIPPTALVPAFVYAMLSGLKRRRKKEERNFQNFLKSRLSYLCPTVSQICTFAPF